MNANPARQSGRFRRDMVVSIAIIAALCAVLMERLTYYEEYAEKTVTELTITNMRTGLNLRKAEMMMNFAQGQPVEVLGENPMVWLPAPVPNYSGEFAGQAPTQAGDGIWYFDRGARELAYRPNRMRHFVPGPDGVREVRVKVSRRERPADLAPDRKPRPWEDVALVLARPYTWF